MTPPVKVAQALAVAVARLRAAGVAEPQRDARRLMAHALDLPAGCLTLQLEEALPPPAAARFATALSARVRRQPVAQITGRREFWNRHFQVSPDVLDPRPETETLVAAALEQPFVRVLDLGTGSGCILLTLLAERAQASGIGVDISPAALDVARLNAAALGLAERAEFRQADWCAGLSGRFDLIVSNPPYIPRAEWEALAPEVRDWEPATALTPGDDGLAAYRAITAQAPAHLTPGGRLIVETGAGQAEAVAAILGAGGFSGVSFRADLDGRPRVLIACLP